MEKDKLTAESITIKNKLAYEFLLHYDWEYSLIWISKNRSKSNQLRITSKCVPINVSEKDKFYRSRTGWGKLPEIGAKSECSYLLKDNNINIFNYWREFIYKRYAALKKLEKILNKED